MCWTPIADWVCLAFESQHWSGIWKQLPRISCKCQIINAEGGGIMILGISKCLVPESWYRILVPDFVSCSQCPVSCRVNMFCVNKLHAAVCQWAPCCDMSTCPCHVAAGLVWFVWAFVFAECMQFTSLDKFSDLFSVCDCFTLMCMFVFARVFLISSV